MNWATVSENWKAYVPRLMTRFPDLEENTLLTADGNRAVVTAHLAEVRKTDAASADAALTEWLEGSEPVDVMMDEYRDNERIMASHAEIPDGEDAYSDDEKFGDDNTPDTPMGRT
ncbi:hypothetical protein [Yoonia sp. 208BN28-4]|uniref:hypothetical protein n=1 Tax=Yoonia sp. 208BN28-4 TaxID=3126505 RepID=UPI00309A8D03